MKKLISIILCLCMVVAVGCVMAGCGNDEVLQRLDGLQAELQTQSGKIDELQNQNSQLTEKVGEMQAVLDEQAKEINELKLKTSQGELYLLETAYYNGLLTREDLMSIAYYHNGGRTYNEEIMSETYAPKPKTPEILSEEIELDIKSAVAKDYNKNYKKDKKAEDFTILKYYGTYDNCAIVYVVGNWLTAAAGGIDEINGVTFFVNASAEIYAYII